MRAGWQTKLVGEVCNIVGGGTPSRSNAAYFGGSIPWATIRDMKSDWIERTEFSITEAAVKGSATHILPSGTVIVASRVGLGKVCRARHDTAINQDLRGFTPKSAKQLDPQYLFLWFKSVAEQIVSAGTGATVQGVTLPFLRSLQIPLPPLEEQRRIVAVLDEAFVAIATATANAEKNLANARELFERYGETFFSELVNSGIKTVALGDLTMPGAGITYGVVKPGGEGSVAFVRGGDLVNGVVRTDQLRTISKEFSGQYRRTLLRGGELLICLVGTPGQCAIAPMELVGANIARQVGMIRLRNELNVEFVRDYLLSAVGQRALGLKTGGSVQQVINLGDLKLIEIPIPDASDQSGIVEKIRSMKEYTLTLERRYRAKLAGLANLKQSLLHRAFTGELTATALETEAA